MRDRKQRLAPQLLPRSRGNDGRDFNSEAAARLLDAVPLCNSKQPSEPFEENGGSIENATERSACHFWMSKCRTTTRRDCTSTPTGRKHLASDNKRHDTIHWEVGTMRRRAEAIEQGGRYSLRVGCSREGRQERLVCDAVVSMTSGGLVSTSVDAASSAR